MYEFLDKLVSVSLPRVRDFHGVPTKSFDGRGNYTLGVKEQLIFPEINFDDVDKVRGMDIVIVTTANTDEEGRELLKGLGMPFTLVANVVDVHTQFIANLNFAVFASVNWLTKVKFQVLPKLLGKNMVQSI